MNNMQITQNKFLKFNANQTVLEQHQTMSICFEMSLWLFENETDTSDFKFTVNAQNFVYTLPIRVNLSDLTIRHVYSSVDGTLDLISFLSVSAIIGSFAITVFCFAWFKKEEFWKRKRVSRAAKHFSVNSKKTAEVQKSDENSALSTQWVDSDKKVLEPASKFSLEMMEQMIH